MLWFLLGIAIRDTGRYNFVLAGFMLVFSCWFGKRVVREYSAFLGKISCFLKFFNKIFVK